MTITKLRKYYIERMAFSTHVFLHFLMSSSTFRYLKKNRDLLKRFRFKWEQYDFKFNNTSPNTIINFMWKKKRKKIDILTPRK